MSQEVVHDRAGRGEARPGRAGPGKARQGKASWALLIPVNNLVAGLGWARPGVARQG